MRAQGARAMTPTEERGSSEARDAGSLAPGARCLGALVSRWRQSVGDLAIVDVEAKVLADARERLEEVVPDLCLVARCLAACSPSASPRAHDAQRRARRRVCGQRSRRRGKGAARARRRKARARRRTDLRAKHIGRAAAPGARPHPALYRRSFSALPPSRLTRFASSLQLTKRHEWRHGGNGGQRRGLPGGERGDADAAIRMRRGGGPGRAQPGGPCGGACRARARPRLA